MRAPAGNVPPRAGSAAAQPTTVETPSGETAEVLSNAPVKRIDAEDVGQRDGLVAGSVVDQDAPPPKQAVTVERWVVTKETNFSDRGHRVKMPLGKVVDSLNYDIKHLLRQGVRMTRLEEGQDAADVLAEKFAGA